MVAFSWSCSCHLRNERSLKRWILWWLFSLVAGHLVVEVLLIAVILFQLSRKSYKPPKKPLTEKVSCVLCGCWFTQLKMPL